MRNRYFIRILSALCIMLTLTSAGPGVSSGLVQVQKKVSAYKNLVSWSDFSHRKVIIFGDSIAFGTAASPLPDNAWFTLFCNFFGYPVNTTPQTNFGISGQQIYNDGVNPPFFDSSTIPTWDDSYGVCIIALGVNDARHSVSIPNYQTALDNAISVALGKSWPANRILIMSPYWITINTSTYSTACQTVAQKYHTMYADMRALILAQGDPTITYISGDNVHPTTTGHALIATIMQTISLTPL